MAPDSEHASIPQEVGTPGPVGSAGARGISVPDDQPYGTWHPAVRALQEKFADIDFQPQPLIVNRKGTSDQVCVRVSPDRLLEVLEFLRDDPRCDFDFLSDLTCVDYLHFPGAEDRYGVTYNLVSTELRHRLWVKCFVNDPDPAVPSVVGIWPGANWYEREVYDLFGIRFDGHPNLVRIMTWEGFGAHPLRKDYPLKGLGERENYEIVDRDSA